MKQWEKEKTLESLKVSLETIINKVHLSVRLSETRNWKSLEEKFTQG